MKQHRKQLNAGLVLNFDASASLQMLAGFQAFDHWKHSIDFRAIRAKQDFLIQELDCQFDYLLVFGEPEAWEVQKSGLHTRAQHTLLAGVTATPIPEGLPDFTLAAAVDTHALGVTFAEYIYQEGYRSIGAQMWYGGFEFCEGVMDVVEKYNTSPDPFIDGVPFKWDANWPRPAGQSVWSTRREQLRAYIQKLKKPLCVFIETPADALDAVTIADEIGLSIPDELGIVGMGFPNEMCRVSRINLTNVPIPWDEVGLAAARQLDRMTRGAGAPTTPELVTPGSIQVRASSTPELHEDARVRKALRFIRTHACEGISVPDVCRIAGACQSLLSTLVKQSTGKPLKRHIETEQVREAKDQLLFTRDPLPQIATRCGFGTQHNMINIFKKIEGVPPGTFRKHSGALR